MKVYTHIKPITVTAQTKELLLLTIKNRFNIHYRIGSRGSHWVSDRGVVVFNLEKYRSKRGVRKAHWVAHVYVFPHDLVNAIPLEVNQKNRNFEVKQGVKK